MNRLPVRVGLVGWALLAGAAPAARAARVTLQQGVAGYTQTADAWVKRANEYNYGASTQLFVKIDTGSSGYGADEDHLLVRFGLPVVPHGTVRSAVLSLFYEEPWSMSDDNAVVLRPWRVHPQCNWYENGYDGEDHNQGVNWKYFGQVQTNATAWTYQEGGWYDRIQDGCSSNKIKDYGGDPGDAVAPGNWVPFEVAPAVNQWYGGQANNGWLVYAESLEGGGIYAGGRFAARDTANTARRPRLALHYQNAAITWTGAADGHWDTNTSNWMVGGYPGAYDNGDTVTFQDAATRTNIMPLDAPAPAWITFSNNLRVLTLAGGIGGDGGVEKMGTGTVYLKGSNTYAGAVWIRNGTLVVGSPGALGSTAAGTSVSNGAALALEGGVDYAAAESLALSGGGLGSGALFNLAGTNRWAGPVHLAGPSMIGVARDSQLALDGPLTGAYSLAKSGPGTLVLGGPQANTYAGPTLVNEGTLALDKPSGPALRGTVTIGDGTHAAAARLLRSDQLAPDQSLTLRSGATLEAGSFSNTLGALFLEDALITAGRLTLTGTVTYAGTGAGAGVAADLDLAGGSAGVEFNVGPGAGGTNLLVTGELGGGALRKTGAGLLALRGAGTFTGGVVLAAGALWAGHPQALGSGAVRLEPEDAGATLWIGGPYELPQPVILDGTGTGTLAAGFNTGVAVLSGPIAARSPLRLDVPSGATLALAGNMDDAPSGVGLTKTGAGTLDLASASSSSGATVIAGGILLVNNGPDTASGTGAGEVRVAGSGTLGGTGRVAGALSVLAGGRLSPGNTIGTLTVSNHVTLYADSALRVDTAPGTGAHDELDLQFGGIWQCSGALLEINGLLAGTNPCVLIRHAREVQGTFRKLPPQAKLPPPNDGWYLHYTATHVYCGRNPEALWNFRARADHGTVQVSWRTAAEIDATGYDLYRWTGGEWTRVNTEPLPAAGPNGACYALDDPGATPGGSYEYRLVENLSGGFSNMYGPYVRAATDFIYCQAPSGTETNLTIWWSSRTDEVYAVEATGNMTEPFVLITNNLSATPAVNRFTDGPNADRRYYRIRLVP